MLEADSEFEKLTNLDGPAREVIRNNDLVRCYYPDAKIIRIEPRSFRNAFPSLLPQQLNALAAHYFFRKGELARIAGLETQAFVFEPKDGLRYGHKFWADIATGLLLKARLLNEKNEPIEQFAFTDIQIGAKLDRDLVKPSFASVPSDWQVRESPPGEVQPQETGWVVKDLPAGFAKVVEGFRTLRGKSAGAPGLFGRAGRRLGVRRGRATYAAAGRSVATGRHQRLQPAARRSPGHGTGRGARCHGSPDCILGRASIARASTFAFSSGKWK